VARAAGNRDGSHGIDGVLSTSLKLAIGVITTRNPSKMVVVSRMRSLSMKLNGMQATENKTSRSPVARTFQNSSPKTSPNVELQKKHALPAKFTSKYENNIEIQNQTPKPTPLIRHMT
jgi:hypothetical protein